MKALADCLITNAAPPQRADKAYKREVLLAGWNTSIRIRLVLPRPAPCLGEPLVYQGLPNPGSKAFTATRWTETGFDGFGRPTLVGSGYSSTYVSFQQTEYDWCACTPLGKVKRVSLPWVPGAAQNYWTTYTYDALGRTISVTNPDNSGTTTYDYNDTLYPGSPLPGSTVKVTDPQGKWKVFVTNAMGNLIRVIEQDPTGGATYHVTNYTYDVLDKLTNVSMPRSSGTQTRTMVYNANQRLQSATNPETGTVTYTYNTDGSVATKTDAKNQKTEYSYAH